MQVGAFRTELGTPLWRTDPRGLGHRNVWNETESLYCTYTYSLHLDAQAEDAEDDTEKTYMTFLDTVPNAQKPVVALDASVNVRLCRTRKLKPKSG